jgi:hypothetical protein
LESASFFLAVLRDSKGLQGKKRNFQFLQNFCVRDGVRARFDFGLSEGSIDWRRRKAKTRGRFDAFQPWRKARGAWTNEVGAARSVSARRVGDYGPAVRMTGWSAPAVTLASLAILVTTKVNL